ncbi:MAG: delta-60 repeat domain-containing protein, partial [Acidimicrobiaceae bacterium]|nr:delta-60 repeat domain-containing protein [Acidimicrobiaceae bacterium]
MAVLVVVGSVLGVVPRFEVPPAVASHGAGGGVTLVSNLGQSAGANAVDAAVFDGEAQAQRFRTGDFAGGYSLSSIELRLTVTGTLSAADVAKFRVELWIADSDQFPVAKLADLVVPSSLASGVVAFDAPEGTVLSPNTNYNVIAYASSALSTVGWISTTSTAADAGAASGWTVGPTSMLATVQTVAASTVWSRVTESLHVGVKGYLLDHAGDLDPTFGIGGKVSAAFNTVASEVHGLAEQADGKVVAVGFVQNASKDFALVRYNRDGSLDRSFGEGGRVVTDVSGGAYDDEARAVAIQDDGRIVVAGYALVGGGNQFALARYNVDGSLDTGFGEIVGNNRTGSATYDVSSLNDGAWAVAVQSDGKIVAAGAAGYGFGVLRVHEAGDPDGDVAADPMASPPRAAYTGFGGNGRVETDFTANVFD